jgi:ABC-type phosphate transport system substrate-binding protein
MRSMVAVGALALTAATVMAVPAMADPINSHGKKVTPAAYDIVSVGSESLAFINDQLSFNYNKTVKHHGPSHPYYYSWDGVPAGDPNNTQQVVTLKKGCKFLRPDGSSAGIIALSTYGTTKYKGKKYPCVDFARSSRGQQGGDPNFAPGGAGFEALFQDAVTYSVTSNSNAPNNLTEAQLAEVFGCTVPMTTYPISGGGSVTYDPNTWGALLGPTAKDPTADIDPILPQQGSGTLSFFTGVLGIAKTEPKCGTAFNDTVTQEPEENEGIDPGFLVGGKPNPNVIFPFSVGVWLAQQYRSAKCGKKPTKKQNMFGCAENGVLKLDGIGGVAPFTGSGAKAVTNPAWKETPFERFLYAVVPFNTTKQPIPTRLLPLLGKKGYFCSKKATSVVHAYGFETTPLCGIDG